MVRKLFEAGTNIIYEEQPFYSLERIPKLRENGFGMRYLVKLAVAGAVFHGLLITFISYDINKVVARWSQCSHIV